MPASDSLHLPSLHLHHLSFASLLHCLHKPLAPQTSEPMNITNIYCWVILILPLSLQVELILQLSILLLHHVSVKHCQVNKITFIFELVLQSGHIR